MPINLKIKLLTCWPSLWCRLACAAIRPTYSSGHKLPRVSEISYLWVYLVQSITIKCSLDATKRRFYQAANSIFGTVGGIASEEVVFILYTAWSASSESQLSSLNFVADRFCIAQNQRYAKNCKLWIFAVCSSILNCPVTCWFVAIKSF